MVSNMNFILILAVGLFFSSVTFAHLIVMDGKVFYKNQQQEIFLFKDANYCFDPDAFSVEKLGRKKTDVLVVNFTEDCNPSGLYRIFEVTTQKSQEFYLSPLYDPEFKNDQIIERFKDGAISHKRIYALRSGKYSLQEQWKSLAPNINISTYFLNGYKVYVLKDDLGRDIQNLMITSPQAFLFDRYFIRKKAYLIQGDRVKINHIAKNKDNFYLSIDYIGKKNGVVKAYIMLSDVI